MSSTPPPADRARELFDAALECSAGERAAFLDSACDGDPVLRRELDSLLSLHAEAEHVLREPLAPILEQIGDQIGPYKLLAKIGEGGFGTVFMAQQEQPITRKVALKIIKLGMDTRQVVARFDQERHALALMDHPNIAGVLDAGATRTGRPYFVMELVQGVPITDYCDRENLSIGERLELFGQLCGAIQHAHQKGIIHRDIKPSNILVGTQDGRPVAKVIDFGISKATSSKLTEMTLFTLQQQVIGTLQYMSPEQAEGSPDIDTRADVYSLGVLLYELLTGSAPFEKQAVPDLRMIREVDPPKPSTRVADLQGRLADISAHRRTQPRHLGAILRGELDWIVMRALEKDRHRRYESASGLAADIRRHLDGEAVLAGPPSRLYRLRKAAQRYRFAAALLSGIVAGSGLFLFGLQSKNSQLRSRNADLQAATRLAHASEVEAIRQEHVARTQLTLAEEHRIAAVASERSAKEQEALAQRERANVFKLSVFQTLDDLGKEADALWPLEPRLLDRYREWMKKAEELVARIPEFRASLAELEQRAVPRSAEELARDRASHPRAGELEQMIGHLGWVKRMLGEEPWPSEAAVDLELSRESLPAEASALDELAWVQVDPDRPVYGSEVKALLLARRALAAATESERPMFRATLAWALLKLGRTDEALAEMQGALEEAGPSKRAEYSSAIERMQSSPRMWLDSGEEWRERRRRVRADLARRIVRLTSEVERRQVWRFHADASGSDTGDRWWHDRMSNLVAELDAFEHPNTGLMHGVSAHGWGVGKRLEFAAGVEERSLSGAQARQAWSAALTAIAAAPQYGGWQPKPQLGLLPIGADPQSGLWEFAHLLSGEAPLRAADGKLILTEEMGLVFVLIPGGKFWMGAQNTDPAGRNYDPQATEFESPVREVRISPFFLSKYEMTQGQWLRFTARRPSRYRTENYSKYWSLAGSPATELHPVEQVSWADATTVLQRMNLTLPTSAQWEYGCRGGTCSVYWSGDVVAGLGQVANLADAYAHTHGGEGWTECELSIDDGNTCHARVGSYRANAFGLHDVHGNVEEWCLDQHTDNVPGSGPYNTRIARGGSFLQGPFFARSAFLDLAHLEETRDTIGLRPAMDAAPLQPPPERLRLGDAAPPLSIAEWIHGTPVPELERGKPYVIAFWSSGCEGCRANLATFNDLQERHANRGLRVIAVAQRGERPTLASTRKFAKQQGESLRITLAWDKDGLTTAAYEPAQFDHGHPALIVDPQGRVAFIGLPSSCEAAFLALEHAAWDSDRARGWIDRCDALLSAETPQGEAIARELAEMESLLDDCPPFESTLADFHFGLLHQAGRLDEAHALGDRLVSEAIAARDAGRLNILAWMIVDPEARIERRDLDLALRAALGAVELEQENWLLLDTLARTYFWRKDLRKAIELQRKVVKLSDDPAMRKNLEEYEAAAEAAGAAASQDR